MLLTEQGRIYTFGATNGIDGQQKFTKHSYLFKEGKPIHIRTLEGQKVIDIQSSLNHTIALVEGKSIAL